MNFNAVCRTCLATEKLIPIFAGSVEYMRYSAAIFVTTGIKVNVDDGLPQQMCTSCISFSNDSLKFRKQCKDAQTRLLQVKQEWCNAAERVDSAATHSEDCNGEGLQLETKTEEKGKTDEDLSIKNENESILEDYKSGALYTAEEELFQLPGAGAAPAGSLAGAGERPGAPAGPPPQLALGCFVRLERFPLQEFLHSHTCETCLVTFSSPSSLNSHQCTSSVEEYVDKVNDESEMRFQSFCGKNLAFLGESKEVQIEKHVATHSAKEDGENLAPQISDDAELIKNDENSHSANNSCDISSQESTKTSFIKPLKSALTQRAKSNKTAKKHRSRINKHMYPSEMIGRTRLHSGKKPYGCDVCKKQFIFNGNLISHMSLHIGKKYYSCGVCGKWFARKHHQTRHTIQIHKGVQLHRCDICKKDFALNCHLSEHIESHKSEELSCRERIHLAVNMRTRAGEKPLSCDISNKQFKYNKYLLKHLLSFKNEFARKSLLIEGFKVPTDQNISSGSATCDEPTKKLNNVSSELFRFSHPNNSIALSNIHSGAPLACGFKKIKHSMNHVEQKQPEIKYSCLLCKEEFGQKLQLSKHMKGHANQNPISCSICDKQFEKKKAFWYHMRAHHTALKYSCDVCNKGMVNKVDLVKHMRVHTGERPFVCHICGQQFKNDSGLISHVHAHNGYKPYPCSVCSKRFLGNVQLRRHMLTHTGEKRYSCDLCKKEFALKISLAKHIERHTSKPKFSCKFCSKLFWSQAILTNHIRIHTGETPFTCSVCGKRFKVKSALPSHMLTHTGEKLFSCDVCKTAFPRKNALITHMKIHSGEKEFACHVCNKYFRHKHVRNNHVLRVHKVNVGSVVGKNNSVVVK